MFATSRRTAPGDGEHLQRSPVSRNSQAQFAHLFLCGCAETSIRLHFGGCARTSFRFILTDGNSRIIKIRHICRRSTSLYHARHQTSLKTERFCANSG